MQVAYNYPSFSQFYLGAHAYCDDHWTPSIFLFSREGNEPPHIHVESADNAAKFWLSPVSLDWASGYNARELRQLRQ
jgi:hypothetical protein